MTTTIKPGVVIDVGSYNTHVGFSGDEYPTHTFSSRVTVDGSEYTGELYQIREEAKGPFAQSTTVNWDRYEELLNISIHKLQISPEEYYVFLSCPVTMSYETRGTLARVVFERTTFAGLFVLSDTKSEAYAHGYNGVVVVDIGHTRTVVTPIFEQIPMLHCIKTSAAAGSAINRAMQEANPDLASCSDQTMTQIKQQCCEILEIPPAPDHEPKTCVLPDDRTVTVGRERFTAPHDVLFPEIPELVNRSVDRIDEDCYYRRFHSFVIVTGGCSNIPGLRERFERDLPEFKLARINSDSGTDSWVGGSIMSDLSTFKDCMWITRAKFEEFGERIVCETCYE